MKSNKNFDGQWLLAHLQKRLLPSPEYLSSDLVSGNLLFSLATHPTPIRALVPN